MTEFEEEEKEIVALILKYGTAWEAYVRAKEHVRILRDYLGMTDEGHD